MKKASRKQAGSGKKSVSKKSTSKKSASKKSAAKKTAKKTAKKAVKKPAKKAVKKSAEKRAPKQSPSKSTQKSTTKPATKRGTKPPGTKPTAGTGPGDSKPTTQTPAAPSTAGKGEGGEKSSRKGITIVSKRPVRKSKPKPKRQPFLPPEDRLLGPGSPVRKPLIPSGPSVTPQQRVIADDGSKPRKSPFGKRELNKYRASLLIKRAELLGDVEQIESEVLLSESGELSSTPQHLADQGSDSYEKSLSLDLAAADRRLIKEIDDALGRIAEGTFGLCEMTGEPIATARLNELPWARYSIEAAREIERRGGF